MNAEALTKNIPDSLRPWLDSALLPLYGLFGLALWFSGRYIDNKFIRPPSKTGFGKGAPGFITNTRKIKVTPEIAARLRRGEQVDPSEIEAAVKAAEDRSEMPDPDTPSPPPRASGRLQAKRARSSNLTASAASLASSVAPSEVNEWIPDAHVKKPTQRKGRKK